MTLRAILSPIRLYSPRTWALLIALLAWAAVAAAPAPAAVQSIEVVPASPTACDSVALVVKGVMPTPCHALLRVRLGELKLLPTMGPLPSYEVGIRVIVQEPNPDTDPACPLVLQPYERKLYLPYHPFGTYRAQATEYLVPYSPDSTAAPKDSTSSVETTFQVAADSCVTPGCYLLTFNRPGLQDEFCDAAGPPGGTACVTVSLSGFDPVAGLQSVIHVTDPRVDPGVPVPASVLMPVSVEAVGEADGFQVSWTAEGSTVRFLLYSSRGKVLIPGAKRILRVCYAIGSGAEPGPYRMRFGATVVSDPLGHAIPPCPTLREEVGRLCVGEGVCDLDGNGVSNVLDIIRLARCALGGHDSTAVCPDTTAARADCNLDGHVDVRDVVCCIRNILLLTRWHDATEPGQPSGNPIRVRFLGPAVYYKPDHANVAIEVDPGADFGAAAVEIEAPPGVTITGIAPQDDPNNTYAFESEAGDGQRSRFLILRASDQDVTQPIRAWVSVETDNSLPRGAALRIVGAEGGSWSQVNPVTAEIQQSTAAVKPYSVPAPRVLPARPNPFTSGTDIWYELDSERHVTVRVYSATGKLVRTLLNASMPRGIRSLSWNGRDDRGQEVGSGIYFVKVSIPEAETTIRIMRLR